ncbi:sialate O-acetylesterase [Pedobacter sp. KR3-3]|uniref:Sialate O-acetylesterase n=1 Tax=Pedobacter albus TaxID=3113905 RepID=A0ABU7I2N5_9SPHI|nr:sialate O-acetylesterase [Pedobacter sp. KR3-3]MEE1943713.1 sialate O-acetylesterase [Pedobacter sp. KR3-3]
MKKIYWILVLLFLMGREQSMAMVRLPSVIASNMVLQRQSNVNLWGWSDPAEKIYITTSWNNKKDSVTADGNAQWKINIPTPVAGGPYTITIKGNNQIVLSNILIGEVWVCAGQSNMEWSSYQGLKQMLDELPNSANDQIRLFQVAKTTASNPQDDCVGQWKVCGPESLKGFSAIGYFYAKKLQQELGVPVGVVNASWGGTPAEVWTAGAVVEDNPVLKNASSKLEKSIWWPTQPGRTYNAMISPLTNLAIAGVIWYQGESNTSTNSTYQALFTAMIADWRKQWQKEFPFYFVQIAPYKYNTALIGALLREQQAKSLALSNTGMVVITDLVDDVNNIHPQNKLEVANRLAKLALSETYKKDMGIVKSPMFKKMEHAGNKMALYFDNAPNGFMVKGNAQPSDFYIAGDDQTFLPAEVKLEKDRIVVWNKTIQKPVAIRFAFSNTAMANVFSKEGLPVTPFRTDDWKVETTAVK